MTEYAPSASTQWTLIVRAQGHGPEARAALGELFRRYDAAILGLIRRFRHPPGQTAEDVKQEFVMRCLARGDVAALDRDRGSFRAWLTTAVRRHLSNAWKAFFAARNAHSKTDYPEHLDAACGASPEELVCEAFAVDTVRYVLAELRASARDARRFAVLERFLPGPQMDLEEARDAARSLGMTETAARKAVHDLRLQFRRLLRRAVADTLELDSESGPEPQSATASTPGSSAAACERGAMRADAELERELALLYRSLCEPPRVEARLG